MNDAHPAVDTPTTNPQLPHQKRLTGNRFHLWLYIAAWWGVCFVGGFSGLFRFDRFFAFAYYFAALSAPEKVLALLLALPLVWLTLFAHELGHVVAGKLVGYRIWQVTVGKLIIKPLKRGFRFRVNWLAKGLAGSVEVYTDAPEDPHLRRKHTLLVLGGPLGSLLIASVSFGFVARSGLQSYAPGELYTQELWLLLILSWLGAVAAGQTVITLLPFYASGSASDGLQLLGLWSRNPAILEDLRQAFRMSALYYGPTELRAWDLGVLSYFDERDDAESRYLSTISRYYHSHNAGDIAAAQSYLEKAFAEFEASNTPALAALHYEKACFYAFHFGDTVMAQTHFEAGRRKHGDPDARRMAKTALRLAEGRFEEALRLSELALRLLDRERDSGYNRAARDWVVAMRARALAGEALRDERPAS